MKGVISGIAPSANVIDLNHEIPPQSVPRAAFELLTSVSYFPSQSLFVTVVDPGVGSKRRILFVQTKKYFFLAPDNGLLSWIMEKERPKKIVSIENERYFLSPVSRTFHGRDVFSPVAAHWANGVPVQRFGPAVKSYRRLSFPQIRFARNKVLGKILAVDRFGNLASNFPNGIVRGKPREKIVLEFKDRRIQGVSDSYAARLTDEESSSNGPRWLVVEGSHGFLEIACNQGNAAREARVREGESLTLTFRP